MKIRLGLGLGVGIVLMNYNNHYFNGMSSYYCVCVRVGMDG